MKTRFPSDFDIFSPSMRTMAWCIQWRTNTSPVAASLCAASHSWWGKIRSEPPPCRSIVVSSSRNAERGALDVPTRATGAPQRLPRRLTLGRRLPQHEVERIVLVRVVGVAAVDAGQLEHLARGSSATPGRSSRSCSRRSRRRPR